MSKAHHFAPPLLVLFLGCTALSGGAQAGWFDFGSSKTDAKPALPAAKDQTTKDKTAAPSTAVTLDESIRQAQLLRLAGNYQEAVKNLSQLMMVAADDPRVVSEYGKTLAMMGRASDAVNFLTRAEQLQPRDWSVYSALGVAYDEVGNQKQAQLAYEHALALKPGDPSVLNNYALSRLLAKDTEMARSLAARAEAANTSKDDKITRNVAMIRSMAPEEKATSSFAASKPQPAPVAQNFAPAPQQAMPRPLQPASQKVSQAPLPAPSAPKPDNRVVMQRVPVDPLAGPVASHAPHVLHNPAKTEGAESAKTESAKTSLVAKAEPQNAKTEAKIEAKPQPVLAQAAKPEAVAAKTEVKPAPKAEAKAAAARPVSEAKALPSAKAVVNLDAPAPSKVAAKAPTPKVLPPTPIKAANAKPAPVKPAKPDDKDAIPGLRLSANAY